VLAGFGRRPVVRTFARDGAEPRCGIAPEAERMSDEGTERPEDGVEPF